MKRVEHHPTLKERLTRPLRRWMLKRVRQRLQREWDEYAHDPEIKLGRLFKGMRQREGKQVFRSLVQVNFYPRERSAPTHSVKRGR